MKAHSVIQAARFGSLPAADVLQKSVAGQSANAPATAVTETPTKNKPSDSESQSGGSADCLSNVIHRLQRPEGTGKMNLIWWMKYLLFRSECDRIGRPVFTHRPTSRSRYRPRRP